jgi:hypothetical protein
MYLASLDDGNSRYLQACARIAHPAEPLARSSQHWRETLTAVSRAIEAVPPASVTMRVALDATGALSVHVAVLARAEHEATLRRWCGGLTRLERLARGAVEFSATREGFDAALGVLPPRACRVSAPPYRERGAWVACDVHMIDTLGPLLIEALGLGFRLVFQANALPVAPSRDVVREARRNLLALRELPGVPAELVNAQGVLAEGAATAGALVEEFVACDAEGESWLHTVLVRHARERFGAWRLESPTFAFGDAAEVPGLDAAIHSALLSGGLPPADEWCAIARPASISGDLVAWAPPETLRGAPDGDHESADVTPFAPSDAPPPDEHAPEYAFVSYRHGDAPRVFALVRAMRDQGIPCWYDRGIPGGSEWDAVIEERIARCRALVVFLSNGALQSKFVRREIKFADALDKPIVSVLLEPVHLGEGLRMLLTQYQMLEASHPDIAHDLQLAWTRDVT